PTPTSRFYTLSLHDALPILSGADALDVLNQEESGGNNAEFSSFKSGTTYFVKVLGTADLIQFFSYGIYNRVNSFVADKPSKKSADRKSTRLNSSHVSISYAV